MTQDAHIDVIRTALGVGVSPRRAPTRSSVSSMPGWAWSARWWCSSPHADSVPLVMFPQVRRGFLPLRGCVGLTGSNLRPLDPQASAASVIVRPRPRTHVYNGIRPTRTLAHNSESVKTVGNSEDHGDAGVEVFALNILCRCAGWSGERHRQASG